MRHDVADPKITEQFLLSQDDILDASVWLNGDALHAHVTTEPGANLTKAMIIRACVTHIGSAHTPEDVMVIAPHANG